jgi:inner membrane protein
MTGVAVAIYGITQLNQPMMGLVMVTAPFGAMLPDIDHDNSKLGHQRKAVTSGLGTVLKIALPIAAIIYIAYAVYLGEIGRALTSVGFIAGGVALAFLASRSKFLRENIQWATKHRGFMHTLCLPALLALTIWQVAFSPMLLWLLVGLGIGFLSHIIIADFNTISGVPLLWPLTKKCLHLLPIVTGTAAEKVFVVVYCLGTIILVAKMTGAF